MKLYYSPGACSLSVHIVLCELGLPHTLQRVDLKSHALADDGADYYAVNPKGYVPALQLDDGQVITEVPAILQYLADQRPQAGLLPPAGTMERVRVQEWLTFIGTEIHKSFGPLFNPAAPAEAKSAARAALDRRFGFVDQVLAGRDYLAGPAPSVADAYLFVVSNWTQRMDVDTSGWPHLVAFRQRMAARPAVREAMQAEGLLK